MDTQPMRLPSFLLAGVQKAGTSSVYYYLKQHPQIYMSPIKEPNFLGRDWDDFYQQGGAHRPSRIDTLAKYAALFAAATHEVAWGEASANYLFNYQTSIPQIQKYVPGAQIVLILRHPAERAYSDYLMHLRDCINPRGQRSLSEQIRERAHASFIIRKGYYFDGVQAFLQGFGQRQVRIFLYDDLAQSAVTFMQTLYQVVGVDAQFEPDVTAKAQTAQVPKSRALNSLLRTQNPLRSAIAAGLKGCLPIATRQKLRSALLQLNSQSKDTVTFSPEDRASLISLYREDILRLQDLLQRDLSAWLV